MLLLLVVGDPSAHRNSPLTEKKTKINKPMKLRTKIAATLAVLALASTAHAAPITGTINMGTDGLIFGSGVVLGNSSGVAITNGNSVAGATQVLNWVAPVVSSRSGDFTSVPSGAAVTFATPWVFNPSTSYNPLWSVGGFTFNLSSSTFVFVGNALVVEGTGKLNKAGFDETNGVWTFTTQGNAAENVFSWSSSSTAVARAVPDGGTSVAMLGLSLLGLGGLSRLTRRK